MACQLARAGEEVALLVLIDTPCRPAGPGALFRNWLTWAPNDTQSNTLAAEPIRQSILSALRLHVLSAVARLGIAKRSLEARFRRYPAEANGIALKRHRPAVYAGDAVLLHSEHTSEKDLAVYGGWHRLTGGALVTKAVAGSHYDMMYEPSVAVLAWELASWLGENT